MTFLCMEDLLIIVGNLSKVLQKCEDMNLVLN